jgi:hypothetical protein
MRRPEVIAVSEYPAPDGPNRPTDAGEADRRVSSPSIPPPPTDLTPNGPSPAIPPPPTDLTPNGPLPAIPPPPTDLTPNGPSPSIPPPLTNLTPNGPLPAEPPLPAPPINARPSIPESAFIDAVPLPPTPERHDFVPLRTDPPPELASTWWIRYALFLTMIATIVVVLETERRGEPGDVAGSPLVIGLHIGIGVLVIAWSYFAMSNAERLVPATKYQTPARGWLVAVLWVGAFLAPTAAVLATGELRARVVTSDELTPAFSMAAIVLIAILFVWAPFRYHVLHGRRIGAPRSRLAMWFWAPVIAAVGGIAIVGLGLRADFDEDGITTTERVVLVAVVYGLGALVMALATWRATTVFDEVIEIRWRRWKNEWEQTLLDMSAQPPPQSEIGAQTHE